MYKTVQWTEPRTIVDKCFCNLCGLPEGSWEMADDSNFYEDEVEITHVFGTRYPECSSIESLEIDVCPKCFVEKILNFIDSVAVIPITYKESDW